MLVLSRKADQKISIGDDIVLTVVRIDSQRVRIGIDAPKEVRILRGELAEQTESSVNGEDVLSERELAFAHPQPIKNGRESKNRLLQSNRPQLFSGSVAADGEKVALNPADEKSAPLAAFVSAT